LKSYFQHIKEGIETSIGGLKITLRHLWQARKRRKQIYVSSHHYFEENTGRVTLQYPKESLPLPDIGRYKLHNEIDDCIVCDKCAKVCPVNCIDIEPIKSPSEFGKTSDGTSKRIYAAKFDIDMAKCCFCGLCTTVCPTECLTMTDEYDFSVTNILEHNFKFANLSETEIAEKKELYEQYLKEKEEAKKKELQEKEEAKKQLIVQDGIQTENTDKKEESPKTTTPKMTFKPKIKPK
jgi:formate hydrogenlyase subunit 6/NADH:ubiquinone oxidoreductase subunit I